MRRQPPWRAEGEREAVTTRDVLEQGPVRPEVAGQDGDAFRRHARRERLVDAAPHLRHFGRPITGADHGDALVGGLARPRRLGLDEERRENARQGPDPSAAHDEIRQYLVGDAGILHETIPGALDEARRVDVLAVRQGHQLGVADDPDEGARDQRLQRRIVVDLRDHETLDTREDAGARPRVLVTVQELEHAPIAGVAVDALETRHTSRVPLGDTRQPAETPAGLVAFRRRGERPQLVRTEAGGGELAEGAAHGTRQARPRVERLVAQRLRDRLLHEHDRDRLGDHRRRVRDLAVDRVQQLRKGRQTVPEGDVAGARARFQDVLDLERRRKDRENGRDAHRGGRSGGPGVSPGPHVRRLQRMCESG